MANSFYDLDYIISLGEKRTDLYLSAYQGVLGRLTNIILIYSAIGIYLIPIIQDLIDGAKVVFFLFAMVLLIMVAISVMYTIRLLIPVQVAYLEVSDRYSTELRDQYERKFLSPGLSENEVKDSKLMIDNYLKASYIAELSQAQEVNQRVFENKSSFYYRALIWGLAAIVPYIICIGFHLSRKDEKVQKVHLVLQGKNCKLQEVNVISMTDKASNNDKPINGNTGSSSTTVISTRVPGIDMTQVIASPPHLIKENSAKVETKVIAKARRK